MNNLKTCNAIDLYVRNDTTENLYKFYRAFCADQFYIPYNGSEVIEGDRLRINVKVRKNDHGEAIIVFCDERGVNLYLDGEGSYIPLSGREIIMMAKGMPDVKVIRVVTGAENDGFVLSDQFDFIIGMK